MAKLKLKKKYKLFILNFILILLIIIFILSSYNYFHNLFEDKKNDNLYQEIINDYTIINEDDNSNEINDYIDVKKLKEVNSDVKGWISIPNTNINYPILQGNDNNYYLNRDINKEYNRNGSIFMDYRNHEFNDNNTIIYGHNMNTDAMFSDLIKIINGNLGNKVSIKITTIDKEFTYDIYRTYLALSNDESPLDINKNNYDLETSDYLYNKLEDKTLTLSTCNNNGKKRIIIHAIKSQGINSFVE